MAGRAFTGSEDPTPQGGAGLQVPGPPAAGRGPAGAPLPPCPAPQFKGSAWGGRSGPRHPLTPSAFLGHWVTGKDMDEGTRGGSTCHRTGGVLSGPDPPPCAVRTTQTGAECLRPVAASQCSLAPQPLALRLLTLSPTLWSQVTVSLPPQPHQPRATSCSRGGPRAPRPPSCHLHGQRPPGPNPEPPIGTARPIPTPTLPLPSRARLATPWPGKLLSRHLPGSTGWPLTAAGGPRSSGPELSFCCP